MKKILNINHSSQITGGSDIYFRSLTTLLRDNGYNVAEFYSSQNNAYMPTEIDFANPNPKNIIKFFYNFEAKNKIIPFLSDVDLVHLHIYYGKLTTSIIDAIKKKDIPIVQTLHDYKIVCPVYSMFNRGKFCDKCKGRRYYNATFMLCNQKHIIRSIISTAEQYFSHFNGSINKIDKFITVSNYQKEKLISMGIKEDSLETIYNFLNLDEYCPGKYKGDYFLYFGRIEEFKGIRILLDAALFLRSNYGISVPIKIVGKGNYKQQCVSYCMEHGLKNIFFYDFCSKDEIIKHITGAIASVLPSIWGETFGLTIIESLALERTVIVSDIGGMPEIIDDEIDGYIVKPSDYIALAERMLQLYKNPNIAKEMGTKGREKVKFKFSSPVHLDRLSTLYHNIM